jgi:hypothetical protein
MSKLLSIQWPENTIIAYGDTKLLGCGQRLKSCFDVVYSALAHDQFVRRGERAVSRGPRKKFSREHGRPPLGATPARSGKNAD